MLEQKISGIVISEDNLYLNGKQYFSKDIYEEFIVFLKIHAKGKTFKKIEIDFGSTFYEITNLLEGLIKNLYLLRNNHTEVVLILGKLDLETRIEYLHSLRKLNIKNYKIHYFKK